MEILYLHQNCDKTALKDAHCLQSIIRVECSSINYFNTYFNASQSLLSSVFLSFASRSWRSKIFQIPSTQISEFWFATQNSVRDSIGLKVPRCKRSTLTFIKSHFELEGLIPVRLQFLKALDISIRLKTIKWWIKRKTSSSSGKMLYHQPKRKKKKSQEGKLRFCFLFFFPSSFIHTHLKKA